MNDCLTKCAIILGKDTHLQSIFYEMIKIFISQENVGQDCPYVLAENRTQIVTNVSKYYRERRNKEKGKNISQPFICQKLLYRNVPFYLTNPFRDNINDK